MGIIKAEKIPQQGWPLDPRVGALLGAACKQVPSAENYGDVLDVCPWCDEELEPDDANFSTHDGAYECPHCSKLFARGHDEDGNNITMPRMSRQDRDYLNWLDSRKGK